MKYEIDINAIKGIMIDRTPILQDIRDTYKVSFLLPKGTFIVLFKGEDGIEYRQSIIEGVCKVPKALLKKEQYVEVLVSQIDKDQITRSWVCEPLKITAFLNLRQTQWQVSGGMTDKDCLNRLWDLEQSLAYQKEDMTEFKAEAYRQTEYLNVLIKEKQEKINKLVEVCGDLANRLTTLEGIVFDPNIF